MPATLVKICGTTSARDALLAQAAGADYLGVIIDHPASPRNVALADAPAIFDATPLPVVAVTVNASLAALLHLWHTLRPAALQLHGDEPPALVRQLAEVGAVAWVVCSGSRTAARQRAHEVLQAGAAALLIDARIQPEAGDAGEVIYGGTGRRGDWQLAAELSTGQLIGDEPGAGHPSTVKLPAAHPRVILAGGLGPGNVAAAIACTHPWMVDVISGVEARKGVKDGSKLRAFIAAAKNQ